MNKDARLDAGHDGETAHLERLDVAAEFARHVERKAYELRVIEAARAKVATENDTPDPVDLYLDREQLRHLPHAEPLIVGIIPRNSLGIIRGRDDTYKSFTCLDWALCLATGKPWQDHPTERTRVLYIAGEGAYGLNQRVEAWEHAWHTKIDPGWFITRRLALNLHSPGPTFDRLLTRIETNDFGFVVVDTLRRVSGRADGNSTDMGAVIDNLDRIKQATNRGTVEVIAHTDKSDTDTRGFSGIEDDADFVWHAKRDEKALTLELTKMKDGPSGIKVHLQAKPVLDSLILSAGTEAPAATTESEIKILDTMRELFRDGVSNSTLLAATGLSESTYYRAIGKLRGGGHLIPSGSKTRRYWELLPPDTAPYPPNQATPTNSHHPDTASDLHNSHDSHELPPTPTTPTTLRSGSSGVSESETPQDENDTTTECRLCSQTLMFHRPGRDLCERCRRATTAPDTTRPLGVAHLGG